jgi:hypothetical protein
MVFINEIFKISLFLREEVKIDFGNTTCASDVQAVKLKAQRRFVINFFWLRGYSLHQIHSELLAALGSDAYSEDPVYGLFHRPMNISGPTVLSVILFM